MDQTRESNTAETSSSQEGIRTRINPKSPRQAIAPEPAPAPPRSKSVRNPIVVFLNALLTLMMIGILVVGGVLYWGKSEFDAKGPLTADKNIVIPTESGLATIANLLEEEGVISDSYVFMGGVSIYRQSRKLKAGEYAFPASVSMHEVMDLLVSGKAIMHAITFPEGLTSKQIVDKLRQNDMLVGEIARIPDEGTLLPDTYNFGRGTSRQQILERMAAEHARVLEAIWKSRNPAVPLKTPQELVILASIVEKETGRADERPRVASVFVNRLNKGMRLQSDPTIIYGLAGGEGTLGRPIRRSDIDAHTPYNTYKINGLPPGPIANPGRAALEAVANPSTTDDLYFVADGTGGHAFATTLEEHNRNVVNWRQIEKTRAEQGTLPVDQPTPEAIDAANE